MKFGVKASEAPARSSEGGGSWIKYFGDGETVVRFLQDMSDWHVYYEHFSNSKNRAYPCSGDRQNCPGCQSEDEREAKAARRHLVNVLKDGYVDLYKIPQILIDDLSRYSDKDGGIVFRDYTVVRFKNDSGQVRYSVDREDKSPIDLKLYEKQFQDFETALRSAWEEVWGPLDEGTQERPDVDKPKRVAKKAAAKVEPLQEEDPPFEPAQEIAQPAQEEVIELSEDAVRSMTVEELTRLYALAGMEAPEGTQAEMAENLIKSLA